MSREGRTYADRSAPGQRAEGLDVTTPVAGYYVGKLRSNGVLVGIRLWYGQPADPVTGELLDRSLRWQAEANGEYIEFDDVWPKCADSPISEERYEFYTKRQHWAGENAPDSAYANPLRTNDPLNSILPF